MSVTAETEYQREESAFPPAPLPMQSRCVNWTFVCANACLGAKVLSIKDRGMDGEVPLF